MKKTNETPAETTAQTVGNANGTEKETQTAAAANGNTSPSTAPEQKPGSDTPTSAKEPPRAETIEELQKRLDVELARLNYKRQLANNREKFIKSMSSLQHYINELTNENEFETQSGKLTFQILGVDRYNNPNFVDTFAISNTDLIGNFCNMLLAEMQKKKLALEKELLNT